MTAIDYASGYNEGYAEGSEDAECEAVKFLVNWFRERQPITTNQQLGDYVEILVRG